MGETATLEGPLCMPEIMVITKVVLIIVSGMTSEAPFMVHLSVTRIKLGTLSVSRRTRSQKNAAER